MMNKLIEDRINELRYQTDDNIKNIELVHIPYAYYLKYENVNKYIFDGVEYDHSEINKLPSNKHIILSHNLPFTFQTRNYKAYKANVKDLIKSFEMIPFLLFVNGKLIKWSDITIIRDYRYSYMIIDNVEYDTENDSIVCILAPFNIKYEEGISIDSLDNNSLYFDVDGKYTDNISTVYTSITILDKNTTVSEVVGANSGFRFKVKYEGSDTLEDPDGLIYKLQDGGMTTDLASIISYVKIYDDEDGTEYKVEIETAKDFYIQVKEYGQISFIENCLVFKDGLLQIELRDLFIEKPLNLFYSNTTNIKIKVFKYNKSPKSNDLIYKIPNNDYVKSIIDSDESTLDTIKNEKFNFTFNKKKSYEYNLEQAFKYICNYDFNLFNDIIKSQSKIQTFTYSGKKLKSLIKGNYFYIPRILFHKNYNMYEKSYCIIFVNNKLYEYHFRCMYTPMHYQMYIPDEYINDDDKIEIIHFKNASNHVDKMIINENNILTTNENFISNIEIYSQGIENQLYELDNIYFQTKLDFSYIKESNWYRVNIDEKYYNKELSIVNKNRFAYISTYVQNDTIGVELNLRQDFLYCRNINQYMVFLNGRLLDSEYYELKIPEQESPVDDMAIYFYIPIKENSRLDIFYIPLEFTTIKPYMSNNGYMTVDKDKLHYPLDKECFFYFINGKKVFTDDITNVNKNSIKLNVDMESLENIVILKHIDEVKELSNAFSNTSLWDLFLETLENTERDKLFNLSDVLQSNEEENIYEETISREQLVYELIAEYYLRNGLTDDNTFLYSLDDSIITEEDSEGNGIIGLVDTNKYDKADLYGTESEDDDNDKGK